jgi:CRISPR-associated protein Csb3
MISASIPVDLINPGQVLASLGFLEAADILCSGAVGGFDWSDDAKVRFILNANGEGNPFARVLEFLCCAELFRTAPVGYKDSPKKARKKVGEDDNPDAPRSDLVHLGCFPGPAPDVMTLPIRLTHQKQSLDITHWADGSSRDDFKLYAGNRSAATVASAMLTSTRALWKENSSSLTERPFDILATLGGSFNFDPRGAWTALGAGYSPNTQKHGIAASPVVEMLAAIGLEHSRPAVNNDGKKKLVRYAAWGEQLSPLLARSALAGVRFAIPLRAFWFEFAFAGKNRVVSFAGGGDQNVGTTG